MASKATGLDPDELLRRTDFTWLSPFGDIFRKDNDFGDYLAPFYSGNANGTNNNVVILKYNNNTDSWSFFANAMNETGMDLDQLYILTEILAGSEQPDKELKKLKESGG